MTYLCMQKIFGYIYIYTSGWCKIIEGLYWVCVVTALTKKLSLPGASGGSGSRRRPQVLDRCATMLFWSICFGAKHLGAKLQSQTRLLTPTIGHPAFRTRFEKTWACDCDAQLITIFLAQQRHTYTSIYELISAYIYKYNIYIYIYIYLDIYTIYSTYQSQSCCKAFFHIPGKRATLVPGLLKWQYHFHNSYPDTCCTFSISLHSLHLFPFLDSMCTSPNGTAANHKRFQSLPVCWMEGWLCFKLQTRSWKHQPSMNLKVSMLGRHFLSLFLFCVSSWAKLYCAPPSTRRALAEWQACTRTSFRRSCFPM